jgi:AraC-like DNA-binding protein
VLLSRNYAPSAGAERYIRRHYVFEANLPDDFRIEDTLLAELTFVRILLRGDWAAETSPGEWTTAGPVVLFGANSRPMPVRVSGPFNVIGFSFRPSGWKSAFRQPASQFADQMLPLSEAWGQAAMDSLYQDVRDAQDDAGIVAAIERAVLAQVDSIGLRRHDDEMAQFEAIARTDSTRRVEDVADDLGLSVRQLERRCLDTFGLSPKMILRRSRFLDMATAMRGFSTPSEAELASLRYFDQSHLNREFKRFAAMTPRGFKRAFTPLFTAGLDLRNRGKGVM